MSSPPSCRRLSALLVAGGAFAAVACGSDTATGPAAPAGPPRLKTLEFRPAGAPAVRAPGDGQCVDLGRDADGTIAVLVSGTVEGVIDNFTLTTPLACPDVPQCGYLLLTVTPDGASAPALAIASAGPSIPVAMRRAGIPVGRTTFRVELRDSRGQTVVDAKQAPYALVATVNVQKHCGAVMGSDASVPRDASPPKDGGTHDASTPLEAATDARVPSDAAPPPSDAHAPPGDARPAPPDAPNAPTDSGRASKDAAPRDAGTAG